MSKARVWDGFSSKVSSVSSIFSSHFHLSSALCRRPGCHYSKLFSRQVRGCDKKRGRGKKRPPTKKKEAMAKKKAAASLFNFTITSPALASEKQGINFSDCSNGGPKLDWAVKGPKCIYSPTDPVLTLNLPRLEDILHKHKWFIRFVSSWCWGWRTKTEDDSKSI